MIAITTSKAEAEHKAKEKYGPSAHVFWVRTNLQHWWVLGLGNGIVVGMRRTLPELLELIERGPWQGLKSTDDRRPITGGNTTSVPADSSDVDTGNRAVEANRRP